MNIFSKIFMPALLIFLNISVVCSQPCLSPYDVEPSAEDIYLLEIVNRARANPTAEAAMFNIDLNEGLSPGTLTGEARQPLAFNLDLYKAALAHSQDMIDRDYFSHYTEESNDTPNDRCEDEGYEYWSGENIAIQMSTGYLDINQSTADYLHEILFIDEDWQGRGHRLNILNPSHAEAGMAMASGSYAGYPNAVSRTSDFGRGDAPSYVCGVIYEDKNANAFYDTDEGIPFSFIQIIETGESVEGFAAGAYSLPIYSRGQVTIEAYLCTYDMAATKSVYIGDENIKMDFVLSDFGNGEPIDDPGDQPDDSLCKALSIAEIVIPGDAASISNSPISIVSHSSISFFGTTSVDIDISFPCYNQAVDMYAAIQLSSGMFAFFENTGNLTSDFKAFAVNTTEAEELHYKSVSLPKGYSILYWLVVPTNGGNLLNADLNGYFELGYYGFQL